MNNRDNSHNSSDGTSVTLGEGRNEEDRRRQPRYLFSAAITVRSPGGMAIPGISVEIGTGGMSAMVSGLLREGQTVELDPVVGGRATARVRHKLGLLYGFEFVDLTPDQSAQIAEKCHRFGGYRRTAKGA